MLSSSESGLHVCVARRAAPSFTVLEVHDYQLLGDELTLDIDCAELGRAYRCVWKATAESWAPDALAIVCHWGDDCEEQTTALPPHEVSDLQHWLERSDDVASLRARELGIALDLFDPT